MTPTVVPIEVAAYLAAVRDALGDLGAEERDDLLVEVEASLIETAGDDDRPIAARLGPPEEFAAELRASAGLPPIAAPAAAAGGVGLLAAMRAAAGAAAADPRVRAAGRGLVELAPIWWLARAYVAVVLVSKAAGADWSLTHPAVPRIGSGRLAVVLLLAAAVGSIVVGLRERRRRRRLSTAAILVNLLLALAAIPAFGHAVSARSHSPIDASAVAQFPSSKFVAGPDQTGLVRGDGTPVLNIYPYTRDGRLLHDVLLFDDTGQPLDIKPGDADPTRRVLTAADGQRIFDSFPIRYFDQGTTRVANPNAAPALAAPTPFTPLPTPVRRAPVTRPAVHR